MEKKLTILLQKFLRYLKNQTVKIIKNYNQKVVKNIKFIGKFQVLVGFRGRQTQDFHKISQHIIKKRV